MSNQLFALEEEVFKVIANQKRLEIIQLLHGRELNVSEMVEMLGLRQSNLSQHLTLLRQCKLVTVTKKGREAYYRLTDENIAKAVQLVYQFLQDQYHIGSVSPDALFPIVVDPVCGMRLSASDAYDTTIYNERDYFFCASGCLEKFISHPKSYLI
jgi:DNA-binding transcriptional ArsR family regulator/YHS domain-containing protein